MNLQEKDFAAVQAAAYNPRVDCIIKRAIETFDAVTVTRNGQPFAL